VIAEAILDFSPVSQAVLTVMISSVEINDVLNAADPGRTTSACF
jgi:hypothetical protein